MVTENIINIQQNIEKACSKTGRSKESVLLVAVSKTKPAEMLMEAYQSGIRDFGENKVQEFLEKAEQLPKDIRWHFIGHLQTNKVKYIVDKVYLIHSVDSLKLAKEIDKEAKKKQIVVNILIEVNISGESSKFGINPEHVTDLVHSIAELTSISVKGLMTIPPYSSNPEENRKYFRQLYKIAVDIKAQNIDNVSMGFISMGMSDDYVIAIDEGATLVRVGTNIFGDRIYKEII